MELDIETLQQIVALLTQLAAMLPPKFGEYIALVLEIIGGTSVLLLALKPLVARFVTSPQARAWCDAIIKVFDLVAHNSRGMDLRPLREPKPKKARKP
jgi:hypothetical protein